MNYKPLYISIFQFLTDKRYFYVCLHNVFQQPTDWQIATAEEIGQLMGGN